MSVNRNDILHHERMHLDRFFGPGRSEEFAWELGPMAKENPDFRVRRHAPKNADDTWTYVSVGSALSTASEGWGHEFCVISRKEDPIHVETITLASHFHAIPAHRLSVGSTMRIGRPWIDGASCDWLLVSLPYTFGPAFERCDVHGVAIRFLWLLPIHELEASFIRTRGLEEFERRMVSLRADPTDPARKAAVSAIDLQ